MVLLLGTLISTLLIPAFQSRGLSARHEEEARSRFIQGLYAYDGEVNRSLNSLATTFEFALKATDNGDYKEFQKMALDHYASFDQVAWWRLDSLLSEYLGAVETRDEQAQAMWQEVAAYEQVLEKRSTMLSPAWPLVYGEDLSGEGITLEWFQDQLRPQQLLYSADAQKHLIELMRLAKE